MASKCCLGCKKRTLTCHDNCKTYLDETKEEKAKKDWLKKQQPYAITKTFQKNLDKVRRSL